MKPDSVTLLLITRNVARLAPRLTVQGVRVTTVEDGSAVVGEMERCVYDCVVIDLGAASEASDLTGTLRDTNAIPILVVAAGRSPEERSAALDAGADDCISIPISDRELLQRILGSVRRARSAW